MDNFLHFCNMANFHFERDHGKLSVCIMANVVYGAWQFPNYVDMANFLPFLQDGTFTFERDHGKFNGCTMGIILYGS